MKNILGTLVAGVALMALLSWPPIYRASAIDKREAEKHPIARYDITQLTWASGNTDTLTATLNADSHNASLDPNSINGLVSNFTFKTNNSTNAITYTVTVTNDLDGSVATFTSVPENASTFENGYDTDDNFVAFSVAGTLTFTVAPSGDPGASGGTFDMSMTVK